MTDHRFAPHRQNILCGQAHTVLDILGRTDGLPITLSLSIEEILERAWEEAYRCEMGGAEENVVRLLRS